MLLLNPRPHKGYQSYRSTYCPQKSTSSTSKHEIFTFLYFCGTPYAFLDPYPDPATQTNAGPCWSESENLTFMLCLFKNQLCLFPNEKIVLSINHWCFCSQPIWTILFSCGKIITRRKKFWIFEVQKNFLGLSAEVLYQLCGNGSI